MKWLAQIKQMKWWMFLPFGQFAPSNFQWVVDGCDSETILIRHTIINLLGLFVTVPFALWLMRLIGLF